MAKSVRFREMTEEEYSAYSDFNIQNYARERSRHFKRPFEEELATAKMQVAELLKDGIHTEGHFICKIIDAETDEAVGHIWYHVDEAKKIAFLYDIMVEERLRGEGYGKAALDELEVSLRQMGIGQVALHVFAENKIAVRLYEKQGYYTASHNMQKDLT